jgi:pyrroloquinoline quinone biosynthesis protein D
MSGTSGSPGPRQRAIVSATSTPALARGRRLYHDETRDRWVIQAPERVFSPDPIAVEVLKLCDGSRSVAELADALALRYDAPKERILADVVAMLQDLADKGVVS